MFPEQFRENILYGIIKIVGNHDLSGKMLHDKCSVIYNDRDMCIQASCDLLCRDQRSGRGVGKEHTLCSQGIDCMIGIFRGGFVAAKERPVQIGYV